MSETSIPPSCATLAAQLVVEGALPMIQGEVKGSAPTDPVVLSVEDRAKLGRTGEGATLFYPAGEGGVFFDGQQTTITVWFNGGDLDRASAALHDRLKRAFPSVKQLDEVAHPKNKNRRARVYRVALKKDRLAVIRTSFKQLQGGEEQFTIQVDAQQRER